MTKIKYTSDGDADEVEAFGIKFADGKAVTVSDEVATKLKGNPFFEVVTEKDPSTPQPAQTAPKPAKPAQTAPDGDEETFTAPFTAKDEENGWWAVYDADGKKVKALRKDDAEIFNALSDGDKAKQVETFTAD